MDGNETVGIGETKSAQRKRTVPFETIEPGAVGLLRRMKARQAEDKLVAGAAYVDSGYVVVNEAGEPLRPELYSDRFSSLCRKAGVPEINLHSVRHTLAFMLHRLGVTPGDAAALLGHTVQVHLATYLPASGASGIAAAAAALGGRAVAVQGEAHRRFYSMRLRGCDSACDRTETALPRFVSLLVTERRKPRAWFYEARGFPHDSGPNRPKGLCAILGSNQ